MRFDLFRETSSEFLLHFIRKNIVYPRAVRRNNKTAFDIFQEKYTKGLWKKFFGWSFKRIYGIDASIEFGFKKPQDIESFSSGFKVMDVKEEGGWYFIAASINENA